MNEPLKKEDKFSLKNTMRSTNIMPKNLKDEPNKGRVALIIFLSILPILVGLLSYLSRI